MLRHARSTLLLASGVLFTVACPGDETSPPTPAIAIALSSSTASIAQGGNQAITVTLTRTNFTDGVTLSVEGLPSGVTAGFVPATIPDGTPSSTLTLTASAGATPGNSTLTVKATAAGVTEQSATISLTITVNGNYSLSMNPTSRTITQGSAATSTVNINRTGGFANSVALAVSGAPAGLTTSFDNASTTGNSATLTMTASGSATVGTHTLTITGTAPGLTNQTTTISVTIEAPPSLTSVTVALCTSPGETITWIGYKNEGGAWTQLTPNADKQVTFQATSKVAVRFVHGNGFFANEVLYITAAELQTFQSTCDNGPRTLNGSVANVPADQVAIVGMASSDETVVSPNTTFSLGNLPTTAVDLLASRSALNGGIRIPNSLILRRGITTADGGTLAALDFNAGEAVGPTSANLTVTGLVAGEDNVVDNSFATIGLKSNAFWSAEFTGTGAPATFYGIPSGSTIAGDVHVLGVFAEAATSTRMSMLFFRTMGNKTLALGPALSTPTVTLVAGAPVRYRVQLPSQAEYNNFINWGVNQNGRDLWMTVTAAYLGGAPATWDVTHPDMTGAPGWSATWGLQAGQTPVVYVGAATGPTSMLTNNPGADGTSLRHAEVQIGSPPASAIVGGAASARRPRTGPVLLGAPRQR